MKSRHSNNDSAVELAKSHIKSRFPDIEIITNPAQTDDSVKNKIYLASDLSPVDVTEQVKASKKNIIQRNDEFLISDLELTARLIQNPTIYFEDETFHIFANSIHLKKITIHQSTIKSNFFMEIESFFDKLDLSQNSKDSAYSILDEFYNNAKIDAPEEFAKIYKNEPISLSRLLFKITIEISNDRMAITCADFYGMLKPYSFIERLNHVLKNEIHNVIKKDTINRAGIGCQIIFNNCSFLILGVQPKCRSVISAIIPTHMSNNKRLLQNKSILIIEENKAKEAL